MLQNTIFSSVNLSDLQTFRKCGTLRICGPYIFVVCGFVICEFAICGPQDFFSDEYILFLLINITCAQ
jgi:hypothetical protein